MKKWALGFFLLFIEMAFAQKMTVKDNDGNILMEVNDEGTVGSITLPSGSVPSTTTNKLYNVSGALYWNGSALGMAGSAGGWTDGGANVYLTTSTDKVGIGTSTPEFKLSLDGDGGILAKGTLSSGTILSTSGAGTRLIWYPRQAAFRAGSVDGSQWDNANIGFSSAAMGYDSWASGAYSVSMGAGNIAGGAYAFAVGSSAQASGDNSTAMGYTTLASGNYSTAMGSGTIASGNYSVTWGLGTSANSYVSTSLGKYNVGGGASDTWISTDPLFEIGIGSSASSKANAVTVLKNGNVGIGTFSPEFKLSLDNDGGILAKGTQGSGATLSTTGTGTRLIWYPRKAAFRAGYVGGHEWDDSNVGSYSMAMGSSTTASADYSTAMGYDTRATNDYSTAMGFSTRAVGQYSTALGRQAEANGTSSMAMGEWTFAAGNYGCTAMGYGAEAFGDVSTAMGILTQAVSYASIAIGRCNIDLGTRDAWVSTDPLFEIGNGADETHRANAMTVLKNGSVGIGTTSPAGALDVSSTTQGFLPPRMTTSQQLAISSPPEGVLVYNTSTHKMNYYNGTSWVEI
jgi:hypothetical protein